MCCGRPLFERLLQRSCKAQMLMNVVEGLYLKGYYNTLLAIEVYIVVVEGLYLKGYYNYILDRL